jgi:hypothetical protein
MITNEPRETNEAEMAEMVARKLAGITGADQQAFDDKVMRVGRKAKRTLYLHNSDDETVDGWIVGLVDTPELAAEIVRRWNEE